MGAVGGAERVVDENLCETGEILRESGIVRLLLRVVAGVFQKQNLTRLQRGAHFRSLSAHAIGSQRHVLA